MPDIFFVWIITRVGAQVDDFIVKIYRRENKEKLVGLVEDIKGGVQKKFHTSDELLKILQKLNGEMEGETVLENRLDGADV